MIALTINSSLKKNENSGLDSYLYDFKANHIQD